ncbi:hypothetical protein [Methanocella conradii]|uniref:hypothetical protein n=1 Tax=Methanocella conradii TaxID=1175444 RepID=UPI00157CD841|nr:hypothetical protein [Methanocella conradii]
MIIILYTILTIIFSYPLVSEMTTYIQGVGDAWHDLSMFWYAKKAIVDKDPLVNLTYNNYIYYPYGAPNVPEFPFATLLSVPLQLLLGLAATYNILWLMSFIISAFGAYLLVKYLTHNEYAAIFSGIVFSFSPYHFAHGFGHMGLLTIEWIPFCALYVIKLYRKYSIINSLLAAIFFLLTAMSDLHYLIYMSLFIGLLILYDLYNTLKSNTKLSNNTFTISYLEQIAPLFKKYWLFIFISFIGMLPVGYYLMCIVFLSDNFIKMPITDAVTYSADLTGFFIPSPFHPFYGDWLYNNVYTHFTGNPSEYTTFVGYIVLILSLYTFIILRKDKEIRFWSLSALFFFLMALGPILHIFGVFRFTSYYIPLPFLAFYFMPIIGLDRTPCRYSIMVMLCLTVLAGYGLSIILNKLKGINNKRIFFLIATIILLFEFLSSPSLSLIDRPVFYENISHDKEKYALLEIPLTYDYNAGVKIQYYQVYHNKPIIGGQMARVPSDSRFFERHTPVINELSYLTAMPDILNQNNSAIGNTISE